MVDEIIACVLCHFDCFDSLSLHFAENLDEMLAGSLELCLNVSNFPWAVKLESC
jgi:hypothetical protein